MVKYVAEETADSETFQELVATKYYDDQPSETVKQLVGAETAQAAAASRRPRTLGTGLCYFECPT